MVVEVMCVWGGVGAANVCQGVREKGQVVVVGGDMLLGQV